MSKQLIAFVLRRIFRNLIANFEFVYCCHGNRSRKDQTAKMVHFITFYTIFLEKSILIKFIRYFGKIIAKQGNKPEIVNL